MRFFGLFARFVRDSVTCFCGVVLVGCCPTAPDEELRGVEDTGAGSGEGVCTGVERGSLGDRGRVRGRVSRGRLHRGRTRPIGIRPRRSRCSCGAESADRHDERPADNQTTRDDERRSRPPTSVAGLSAGNIATAAACSTRLSRAPQSSLLFSLDATPRCRIRQYVLRVEVVTAGRPSGRRSPSCAYSRLAASPTSRPGSGTDRSPSCSPRRRARPSSPSGSEDPSCRGSSSDPAPTCSTDPVAAVAARPTANWLLSSS